MFHSRAIEYLKNQAKEGIRTRVRAREELDQNFNRFARCYFISSHTLRRFSDEEKVSVAQLRKIRDYSILLEIEDACLEMNLDERQKCYLNHNLATI